MLKMISILWIGFSLCVIGLQANDEPFDLNDIFEGLENLTLDDHFNRLSLFPGLNLSLSGPAPTVVTLTEEDPSRWIGYPNTALRIMNTHPVELWMAVILMGPYMKDWTGEFGSTWKVRNDVSQPSRLHIRDENFINIHCDRIYTQFVIGGENDERRYVSCGDLGMDVVHVQRQPYFSQPGRIVMGCDFITSATYFNLSLQYLPAMRSTLDIHHKWAVFNVTAVAEDFPTTSCWKINNLHVLNTSSEVNLYHPDNMWQDCSCPVLPWDEDFHMTWESAVCWSFTQSDPDLLLHVSFTQFQLSCYRGKINIFEEVNTTREGQGRLLASVCSGFDDGSTGFPRVSMRGLYSTGSIYIQPVFVPTVSWDHVNITVRVQQVPKPEDQDITANCIFTRHEMVTISATVVLYPPQPLLWSRIKSRRAVELYDEENVSGSNRACWNIKRQTKDLRLHLRFVEFRLPCALGRINIYNGPPRVEPVDGELPHRLAGEYELLTSVCGSHGDSEQNETLERVMSMGVFSHTGRLYVEPVFLIDEEDWTGVNVTVSLVEEVKDYKRALPGHGSGLPDIRVIVISIASVLILLLLILVVIFICKKICRNEQQDCQQMLPEPDVIDDSIVMPGSGAGGSLVDGSDEELNPLFMNPDTQALSLDAGLLRLSLGSENVRYRPLASPDSIGSMYMSLASPTSSRRDVPSSIPSDTELQTVSENRPETCDAEVAEVAAAEVAAASGLEETS